MSVDISYENHSISFLQEDDEIWIRMSEIAEALDYSDPRIASSKLFKRNKDELEEFSKSYQVGNSSTGQTARFLNEQGVYLFCMLAKTPKAKEFRKWVAKQIQNIRRQKQSTLPQLEDLLSEVRSLKKIIQTKLVPTTTTPPKLSEKDQEILQYFMKERLGGTVHHLTNLPKSTFYRHLRKLTEWGYLELLDPKFPKRYRLTQPGLEQLHQDQLPMPIDSASIEPTDFRGDYLGLIVDLKEIIKIQHRQHEKLSQTVGLLQEKVKILQESFKLFCRTP